MIRFELVATVSCIVSVACSSSREDRGADRAVTASRADSVEVIRVNTGPHGMAARVRWLMPSDGHAILAMEDPVGVEAEPVVNGFVFASEPDGIVFQADGIWDVAPSPDWSKLAIARGLVLRGGESDSIPEAEWRRLEGWLPGDVAAPSSVALRRELRSHLFPASGMAYAQAIGLAQVIDLSRFGRGRAAVVEGPTVSLDAWRVRWTPAGDSVASGAAPVRVEDHANPTRWFVIPADARDYRGPRRTVADSASLAPVRWVEGPTIDISVPIDTRSPKLIQLSSARIEARDGIITLERSGDTRTTIGPGMPLAATGSGVYVLALVPRPQPHRESEPAVELVLYAVRSN